MKGVDDRRAADRFWSDLTGTRLRAGRIGETVLVPRGPLTRTAPEPFRGDAPGDAWRVVGGPGARFIGLRADDLVVRRSADGAWDARLAGEVGVAWVFRDASRHLRPDTLVLRRGPLPQSRQVEQPGDGGAGEQLAEVCGFFGPNNVRRTEAQIRAAIVTSANAEWTAWHAGAAPRFENDRALFGRLLAYYLAAVGTMKPDTLVFLQTAALGAVNYAPLLDAATVGAAGTAATALAGTLTTGAPADPGLAAVVRTALLRAREAHRDSGGFSAWSAVFVVACVRGAAIAQGLEGVIAPGRRHVDPDVLLVAAVSHADYTIGARTRRAATLPRRRGTYHAFTPAERAPQRGDIIVLDRAASSVAGVQTLPRLSGGLTHGDIVIDVQPTFVVTIGGNLSDGSAAPTRGEESARKRRYPRDARGFLVREQAQLFTQEDNTGTLPALPSTSTDTLHRRSTARIFALLSVVEECAAIPGQPYRGGVLT
jgi:hypothetical protein